MKGTVVSTPWEGRWCGYELRDGLRVPLEGKVAWVLPDGPKPYWRGRVTRVAHEHAGSPESAAHISSDKGVA